MLSEVSKSVDQLCSQMSLTNISVPKFSSSYNVYDFITEYEDTTCTLTDEQKSKLLNKAFPPGCHRSFYENELKPMVKSKKTWKEIKDTIIERFSILGDRNRHFARLKELIYDPNGNKTLQDFADDVVYSYKRAYPGDTNTDTEACVLFIKSSLPASLQSSLSNNSEYCNAKTIEQLKKAVKHYDIGRANGCDKRDDRQVSTQLSDMMKELTSTFRRELESIRKENEAYKKDNEASRQAIIAAFKSGNQSGNYNNQRTRSPQRGGYQDRRSPSPNHQQRYARNSSSPNRYESSSTRYEARSNRYNDPRTEYNRSQIHPQGKGEGADAPICEAFNSSSYYERFGRPPSACTECNENSWHWARHCYKNLN